MHNKHRLVPHGHFTSLGHAVQLPSHSAVQPPMRIAYRDRHRAIAAEVPHDLAKGFFDGLGAAAVVFAVFAGIALLTGE